MNLLGSGREFVRNYCGGVSSLRHSRQLKENLTGFIADIAVLQSRESRRSRCKHGQCARDLLSSSSKTGLVKRKSVNGSSTKTLPNAGMQWVSSTQLAYFPIHRTLLRKELVISYEVLVLYIM
eukprot:3492781-Amphidinium_carterae.1